MLQDYYYIFDKSYYYQHNMNLDIYQHNYNYTKKYLDILYNLLLVENIMHKQHYIFDMLLDHLIKRCLLGIQIRMLLNRSMDMLSCTFQNMCYILRHVCNPLYMMNMLQHNIHHNLWDNFGNLMLSRFYSMCLDMLVSTCLCQENRNMDLGRSECMRRKGRICNSRLGSLDSW